MAHHLLPWVSVSPQVHGGAGTGDVRGHPALEAAACQAVMSLALNSTSLQPRPPAQHPEVKGHPVYPEAWTLVNVSGWAHQPVESSVIAGCLPHLTDPARTQPSAPLNPATNFSSEDPSVGKHPLPPPVPGEEMEIGTEVCRVVQLGRDVKWN